MKNPKKLMVTMLIMALILPLFALPVSAHSINTDPLSYYLSYDEMLAYFAGGSSAGKPVAQIPININQTVKGNLAYSLHYNNGTGELSMNVKNNTPKTVNLIFPSGKKFDFSIFNMSGQKVWQLSQGKFYTQAVAAERFAPWETKQYKAQLPALASGQYTVVANYFADGINKVVAFTKIQVKNIEKTNPGLSFGATYSGGSQPKIIFAVRNLTASPITMGFSTGQKFEVVLRGDNGYTWYYSASQKYSLNPTSETLGAGVNRFNYLYLPQLAPGKYTAQVYYLGLSSGRPVATTSFTVR